MVKTSIEIENDSYLLKQVSKDLIHALKERDACEEVIFDVQVGFEEALRNAMIHGNKMCHTKKVKIETEVTEECVTISVEDEGEGFDPSSIPDPTDSENLLKESGRGVYLIKHLMDEVSFSNGGKRITMVKCFKNNL